MEKTIKNTPSMDRGVDPGFWVGLVMIALFLLMCYKCA